MNIKLNLFCCKKVAGIQKTVRTTTGKLCITLPASLNEITLGQMMELQEKPDLNDLEAISILSGLPLHEIQNVKNIAELEEFGDHMLILSHQIKHLYNSDKIPDKVLITTSDKSRVVKVIRNLSVEPAGAFMAARDIIAEEINDHIKQYGTDDWKTNFNPSLKACCQVLAHYFYCSATGKPYNEYNAEEFSNNLKQLRVTEALPIAKHFFTCYPNLLKRRTSFYHHLHRYWKTVQALMNSKSLNI